MTTPRPFEIGLFTFGEITPDPATGRPLDPAVRLREFVDLARIADDTGLDVFGVGEHHRSDFAIASPPVVLAAIAQATERIRLTRSRPPSALPAPTDVEQDQASNEHARRHATGPRANWPAGASSPPGWPPPTGDARVLRTANRHPHRTEALTSPAAD